MHTAEGNAGSTGHLVLVHDDMPMRRAELTAFLSHWAALERVGLMAAGMPGAEDPPELHPQCLMVLFSIGSVALERSPALHQVLALAEQHQQIPAVILAEAGSARDAATAFQAGAKGYIPASIEPEVALRALSFILHGGHFFRPAPCRCRARAAVAAVTRAAASAAPCSAWSTGCAGATPSSAGPRRAEAPLRSRGSCAGRRPRTARADTGSSSARR